jgi:phage-related protein
MSISIYSINQWQINTQYNQNDIVSNNNLFYYVGIPNYTSSSNISTDINNQKLLGYISDNNETKPYFSWKPSYGLDGEFKPKIKEIVFGDGYTQRSVDGINNNLLTLNLEFTERDINETCAILHFLYARKGAESFVFITSPPTSAQLRFKSVQWNYVQNFYNNYSIKALFQQVVR